MPNFTRRTMAALAASGAVVAATVGLAAPAQAHISPYPGYACVNSATRIGNVAEATDSAGRFSTTGKVYGTRVYGTGSEASTVFVQPDDIRVNRWYHDGLSHVSAANSPLNKAGTYRYHVQLKSVSGGTYPVHGEFSGSVWSYGIQIYFANGQGPWPNGRLPRVAEWRQPFVVVQVVAPDGIATTTQVPVGFHSGAAGPYSGC